MKKAMVFLGLADGEELYEQEQQAKEKTSVSPMADDATERDTEPEQVSTATADYEDLERGDSERHAEVIPLGDPNYRAPVTPIKRASQGREEATEVHQLITIHPTAYCDARLVGESFRDGIPVIMNVTDMDTNEAKRLVDFASGLAFGLRGDIEQITSKVFLLTPTTVEVITEGGRGTEDESELFDQK